MSFRVALSGLNAASADLGVTANNIANATTTGFKASRAEFADVFAVSAQGRHRPATACACRPSRSSSRRATSTSPTAASISRSAARASSR